MSFMTYLLCVALILMPPLSLPFTELRKDDAMYEDVKEQDFQATVSGVCVRVCLGLPGCLCEWVCGCMHRL